MVKLHPLVVRPPHPVHCPQCGRLQSPLFLHKCPENFWQVAQGFLHPYKCLAALRLQATVGCGNIPSHIRDQGEHGREVKGEKGCTGCNHPARIWASPAGASQAAGKNRRPCPQPRFFGPMWLQAGCLQGHSVPCQVHKTYSFNCITNPRTWGEAHGVQPPLLPSTERAGTLCKAPGWRRPGTVCGDICAAAPELQREPGLRKSEIQSHSAFQEQLCLCHQHELWLMISYAY